ncbi:hypothetical protein SLS58_001922 [Diplodia intermedia]|uniref:Uncharacterized protein n=1 Tax=Diplodia intermedia TaxID=856260 RepID=A0ABR3U0M5_9PEZI
MMRDASAAARTPSRLELRAEYFRTMEQQDPEYGAESDLNGTSTANEELDGVVVGSVSASEA